VKAAIDYEGEGDGQPDEPGKDVEYRYFAVLDEQGMCLKVPERRRSDSLPAEFLPGGSLPGVSPSSPDSAPDGRGLHGRHPGGCGGSTCLTDQPDAVHDEDDPHV
jgi:hypothetical protein